MSRCKNPDDDRYQFAWSGHGIGLKGACEGGPVLSGGLGAKLELIEDAKPVSFAFCGGEQNSLVFEPGPGFRCCEGDSEKRGA